MDPDPHSQYESGSSRPNQCGSGSTTQGFFLMIFVDDEDRAREARKRRNYDLLLERRNTREGELLLHAVSFRFLTNLAHLSTVYRGTGLKSSIRWWSAIFMLKSSVTNKIALSLH